MGFIGFSELLVIILVAICVLKPQQLHSIALLLGKLFGKTKKQYQALKSELNQTIQPPKEK
tara:strand:+ start:53181 stop:53363 length:183 start_codon:yes stop_codon:yes gene_type:complete